MNSKLFFLALIFSWALVTNAFPPGSSSNNIPSLVISDSDIGVDLDDAFDTAFQLVLQNRGEVRILASTYCQSSDYGAVDYEVINNFYGHPEIAIGTLKNPFYPSVTLCYGAYLQTNFPSTLQSGTNAMDAVKVWRRVLADSPSNTVKIVFQGEMSNLYEVYFSAPDDISPLTGPQLLARVKELIIVAGFWNNYPAGGYEYNFYASGLSVVLNYIESNSITQNIPITFVGQELGDGCPPTGAPITNAPLLNPVRAAQTFYQGLYGANTRPPWSQLGWWYLARGLAYNQTNIFTNSSAGVAYIDAGLTNWFTNQVGGNCHYLELVADPGFMSSNINVILSADLGGVVPVETSLFPPPPPSPHLTAGGLTLQFDTVSNQTYTVQFTTNLASAPWVLYTNFIGSGGLTNFLIPFNNASEGFLRVLEQ